MTNKHIPASKLLALPQHEELEPLYEDSGKYTLVTDLRALIDEAPEEDPVALVEHVSERYAFCMVAKGKNLQAGQMLYASPPPSTDLTKLVGELVEFINEVNNWLVCAPIASPDDMAQSFDSFQKQCDAMINRTKDYLK